MGNVRLRTGQEVELHLDNAGLQAGNPTKVHNSCHQNGMVGQSTSNPGCALGLFFFLVVLKQLAGVSHFTACSSHTSFSLHPHHSGLSSPVRNSFVPTRQEKLAVRIKRIFVLSCPLPLPPPFPLCFPVSFL